MLARALSAVDLAAADVRPIRNLVAPDVKVQRVKMVQVLRVDPTRDGIPRVESVVDVVATGMPAGSGRASAERLAAQALSGRTDTRSIETLGTSGDLLHAAR
jgi:hypothetical protein